MTYRLADHDAASSISSDGHVPRTPGKVALTQRMARGSAPPSAPAAPRAVDPAVAAIQRAQLAHDLAAACGFVGGPADSIDASAARAVQRHADGHTGLDDAAVAAHAAHGVSGAGGVLPHLATIQRAFGPAHDLSGVRAHVGGAAAEASHAIGAHAYATGNDVAFASAPDLFLAAHEATHVVQQRQGVSLKGAVGQAGDAYEQHADAIAAAVVRGDSVAERLGDGGDAQPRGAVQRKDNVVVVEGLQWNQGPVACDAVAEFEHKDVPRWMPDDDGLAPSTEAPPMNEREVHARAFAAYYGDVRAVYGAWNRGVGQYARLLQEPDTATAKQLAEVDFWKVTSGANVESLAEAQVVGRGKQPMTVGDVGSQAIGDRDRATAAKMGGEDKVEDKVLAVAEAERLLAAAVADYKGAFDDVDAKHAALRAAVLDAQLLEAKAEATTAGKALAQLQQQKADAVAALALGIKAVEFAAGAAVVGAGRIAETTFTPDGDGPTLPHAGNYSKGAKAKAAGGAIIGEAATAVGGNAAHDVAGMVAEWVVSPFYADELKAAEARVDAAAARVAEIAAAAAAERIDEARKNLSKSRHGLVGARERVAAAVIKQRTAYKQLTDTMRGSKAAKGDAASTEKLSAMVAAIPVVQGVVQKLALVSVALQLPAVTQMSQVGAALVEKNATGSAHRMSQLYGKVSWCQGEVDQKRELWGARLEQVRDILAMVRDGAKL